MTTAYQCPVCTQPLTLHQKTWQCSQNHSFDRHKKGYVNLLLAHQKRSKQPGDDTQMVKSRTEFLSSGHYEPLAESIITQCKSHLPDTATIWDAGSGEGYYSGKLAEAIPSATIYGLDISKPAVEAACRYRNVHWCVASSAHPPYKDAQFDAIISVFSRVDAQAFKRVLKPGGQVIMAAPDSLHLLALRKLIYPEVRPYDTSKHLTYFEHGFELSEERTLRFDIHLTENAQIQHLLAMTPHGHRLPAEVRQTLNKLNELRDTACFKLYRFTASS